MNISLRNDSDILSNVSLLDDIHVCTARVADYLERVADGDVSLDGDADGEVDGAGLGDETDLQQGVQQCSGHSPPAQVQPGNQIPMTFIQFPKCQLESKKKKNDVCAEYQRKPKAFSHGLPGTRLG